MLSLARQQWSGELGVRCIIERREAIPNQIQNMKPPKLLALGIVFVIAVTSISFAETNRSARSKADYKVALRFGKQTPLTREAIQSLYSKALELLETSNFTSLALVHEEYRQTVAGKYLLVSLKVVSEKS